MDGRYSARPLACVKVYGCQQNVSDGERIKGMLAEMGFGFTDSTDDAELVLYNTCAVRGHAEDRVIGNVGALKHYKRRKPGAVVALCGCMMQQPQVAEYIRTTFPFVNLVFGTHVIPSAARIPISFVPGGKGCLSSPRGTAVSRRGFRCAGTAA